jgi:Mg2+ and Co2+ transporter CorA
VSIRALLSRADGTDIDVDITKSTSPRVKKDELLWVDAVSPDQGELSTIRHVLSLGDGSAATFESFPDQPKARVHDDAVEVVLLGLADDLDADPIPLRILIGDGWVLTHHQASIPFLDEHHARIQDQRPVGRLTPIEFLASLLDRHVDVFFRAAETLEREVDELDDAALRAQRGLVAQLVAMRRRIAHVRRVLVPHREVAAELSRPDFLPKGAEGGADALAAVSQRLERAGEAVSNAREMLIGTFDVHMTRTAQRTNDIMRILTLASVILLPSVVIAGVMGMNFTLAFFDDPNMFWVVVGLMAALAAVTLGFARWRGWV